MVPSRRCSASIVDWCPEDHQAPGAPSAASASGFLASHLPLQLLQRGIAALAGCDHVLHTDALALVAAESLLAEGP